MVTQSQRLSNDTPILEHPICAIDFETTGLNKNNLDRAIEIALVRREPGGEIHAWSSLIKYSKSISWSAQKVHNIDNDMLIDAPDFASLYPQLKRYICGSVLIAHNSPFDMAFLHKECQLAAVPTPESVAILDTLRIARAMLNLPRNSLIHLCHRVGLVPHSAHRAMNDARNTLYFFVELLQSYPTSALTLSQLDTILTTHHSKGPFRTQINKKIRALVKSPRDVEILYTSSDPNRPLYQKRIVTPIQTKEKYLKAYCHTRKAERKFRIARIHDIVELPNPLESPDGSIPNG